MHALGKFDQHPFSARINGAAADQQNGTCGVPQKAGGVVDRDRVGQGAKHRRNPGCRYRWGACVEVAGRYIDGQIDLRYARFTRDGFVQCPADRVDGLVGPFDPNLPFQHLRQRWAEITT